MSNHLKGLLIAFFGVLVLTPEGILVKLANSDSFTILFWRGLFLTLSILVILLISYRSNALNQIKGIGKEGLLIGCLTGFGGATFILAIHYTTLAKTLVIISAAPLMVALVSFILLKEKPKLLTWLAMLIVFTSIYIDVRRYERPQFKGKFVGFSLCHQWRFFIHSFKKIQRG